MKTEIKELIEYLKDRGINVTYDENPSKEKIERITKYIERSKAREKKLKDFNL